MANLSEDDREIIEKNHLSSSLDSLQDSLRHAEISYDNSFDRTDNQKLISRLLSILQGEEAAYILRSKTSSRDIASDLSDLFKRVRSGDFNYSYYRPLVKLVIQQAPGVEIWSAVLDLIVALSRITPPTSVPPTFDDTPISHSSASPRGGEQTASVVEQRVFEEIRSCTHRDVRGFFEKYFEGKDWTPRTLQIYRAMRDQHVNGRWIDIPDSPIQAEVLTWWLRFQDRFLSRERGLYDTITTPKDLIGVEARRQIDLFMKRNDGQPRNSVRDWKDVTVIGELKASNDRKKDTLLQLGRYVRDVFSTQPTRRYVHAFTICGRVMEVWIFDRSGAYSVAFDIHDQPERFIQVTAGYTMMSDEELGLDMFMGQNADGRFITLTQDGTGKPAKLLLEPSPITYQRAIVCRGTSCYRTKTPDSTDWDSVTKFSWASDKRRPEAELLRVARQRGVEGIADLFGCHDITAIAEIRSGLTFGKPYRFRNTSSAAASFSQSFSQSKPSRARSFSEFSGLSSADKPSKRKSADPGKRPAKRSKSNSQKSQLQSEVTFGVEGAQGTSLFSPSDGPFDNRILRCLVISPAGRAIHKYGSKAELLGALRDAIKAHRSLFLTGKILHRDISENNIIITDPKQPPGFMGMLIDLDLAKEVGSGRSGARCQTGTMEFMAIEVLLGVDHTYRHDLESFFYVLIWLCGRRSWESPRYPKGHPAESLLTDWYTGNYEKIAQAKRGAMVAGGFDRILMKEFPPEFDCVKPLCRELRRILFPMHKDDLFTGTPLDPEALYVPIIQEFNKAIGDVKATEG